MSLSVSAFFPWPDSGRACHLLASNQTYPPCVPSPVDGLPCNVVSPPCHVGCPPFTCWWSVLCGWSCCSIVRGGEEGREATYGRETHTEEKQELSNIMEESLRSCRRKAKNHKIERWSREQGWENLHNEDGEKHRSKEEQDTTGECANVQESVTEPVPSLVCVSCECVQVQRISPLPLSSSIQIATPQELNLLTCRDKEECPGHNIAGRGVTAVMVGGTAHPSTGDGWTGGKSSPARKTRANQKERKVCICGKHKKTGENQAVVASGRTDSMKDATRRLWAPAKGMISHSREGCRNA